ncbi:MAG: MerR family transcriptional regulator [Planctomycetia bacterium]
MATPPSTAVLTLPEVVGSIPALLSRDYDGVRNGRVRDLPDVRTIRWYQSLGVLDRPTEFRGRAALYGRRHLLQIAVIKKLQASGLSLEEIQGGLPGRTDAELARALGMRLAEVDGVIAARVAARTAAAASGLEAALQPSRRDSAFWKTRPASATASAAASAAAPVTTTASLPLQSKAVGGNVVVLWNGRPLDAFEQAKLAELSAPLVAFLLSTFTSTPPAERVGSAAAGESQPEVKPTRSPKEPRR